MLFCFATIISCKLIDRLLDAYSQQSPIGIKTHFKLGLLQDLMYRLRAKIAERAHLGGNWLRLERSLRPLENLLYKMLGKRIIECFGDSHVNVFNAVNRRQSLPGWHFRVNVVRGATAFGLANPNSRTNAYKVFSGWLTTLPPDRPILFMLGEVDAGYLIWMKAQQSGENAYRILDQALARYFGFLEQYANRFSSLIIVGAPIPAVGDLHRDGAMLELRKGLTASQRERTDMTLKYNRRLRAWAERRGAWFIDMDSTLLDPDTYLLKDEFLTLGRIDHHYNQDAFSRLLCELLTKSGFFDRQHAEGTFTGAKIRQKSHSV